MDWLFRPKLRLLCAALWALAWCVVVLLLLLPMPIAAPDRSDLLVHFSMFALIAFGAVGFSRRAGHLALLTLVTIASSTLLEYAQLLVPARTFDPADAAANALGATTGFALALVVLSWWIRPADPALRAARRGGASGPRSS